MSQNENILNHLKQGPITAIEALNHYGCFRLAARIKDLRRSGYAITTETVKDGDKQYARYHLLENNRATA